jgi:hypothetical protein
MLLAGHERDRGRMISPVVPYSRLRKTAASGGSVTFKEYGRP